MPSFLFYHSTYTETEKCVRKMCLFLMVGASIVNYTLSRESGVELVKRAEYISTKDKDER
jgi:hypothetical protein